MTTFKLGVCSGEPRPAEAKNLLEASARHLTQEDTAMSGDNVIKLHPKPPDLAADGF